jgi:Cu(I)/Ag(I) efflux system membrane fusion protein
MKKSAPLLFVLVLIFAACTGKKTDTTKNSGMLYTCSMDPQIMENEPGKCPICQMELTPIKKNTDTNTDEIQLSEQQIQLGNIHTDTMRIGNIADQMILNATLSIDETKTNVVSARLSGRIDKLYYTNIGDYVVKGTKLFDLYSEELNNAKQTFLLALQKQKQLENTPIDFNQLVQSSKNKLLLWGMTENQINELSTSKKASPLSSFYSSTNGFIERLDVKEGDYVTEGASVIRLADLSTLWVEAQVYVSQLYLIHSGEEAIVKVPDMPDKKIKGKIDFRNPELSLDSKINLIRINISNTDYQLKPGMPAYVTLINRPVKTLSLPIDAVIQGDKTASVWVKTGKDSFKNRMVQTGLETEDRIEIKSGLSIGDVIVISGAYLINSEYIFKKGVNPMGGMDMSKMKM